jgi:hypothetical protein
MSGDNVFQQSSSSYAGGTAALGGVANPFALSSTMNQFVNPYREQVLDNTLNRLQQRKSEDLNMVRSQAARAGAYGGARQGLVEAELMDRYGQQEDDVTSRLLQEGYTSSADLAGQSLGFQLGGGSALVNAAPIGLGMGQSVNQGQQQAGLQQQALLQQILGQASAQFEGYANYPNTALATALAGVQGNPLQAQQKQTQQFQPGLFNYMQMGAGVAGAGK